MKLIELHILQSFPVSCLNRDDVGSPKSAIFGGVQRARISSQCQKRAVRLAARELSPQFVGIRSRILHEPFEKALIRAGLGEDTAKENANRLCEKYSEPDKKHPGSVKTLVYLSPGEIESVAKNIAAGESVEKAIKKATRLDAADIALFGRMVANDASLNIDGAAMFSHALSTHKAANEIDFFSAVDDGKVGADDAGAGMIGTLEFSSATYYRYAAVNLDLLFDDTHLGPLSIDKRPAIIDAFIRATLMAVPGARKNSMNAHTLPFEALVIVKDTGQPIQLINAFETPVSANGQSRAQASLTAMKGELDRLKKNLGPQAPRRALAERSRLKRPYDYHY